VVVFHLLQHALVIGGIDDDGDIGVVLRRRAQHRRPADIDVLDRHRQRAVVAGNGLLERVQVHHHHVDRLDVVRRHDLVVGTAPAKQAAVDFRMQCLHTAVHHFREAGVIRYLDDVDAVFL